MSKHGSINIYTENGTIYTVYTENGTNELTENSNLRLFAAYGKRKTEVCFQWLANDKWLSTIAVSANVPIYA
jgi:hypothetical protein